MKTYYISADYVASLVQFAEKFGVCSNELLSLESMPSVLTGVVAWPIAQDMIMSLCAKNTISSLGLQFGLTLDITQHGLLGYAAKSSKTVLEAILLDEQYLATRTNVVSFRVLAQANDMSLQIDLPSTLSTQISTFVSLAALGCIARMYNDLFAGRFLQATYVVPFSIDVVKKYKHPLLTNIIWREEPLAVRIEVSADVLQSFVPTNDDTLRKLLVSQCQTALSASNTLNTTVDMVRNLLSHQLVEPPSVAQLGQQLNLTERTLKRYLQQEGTSYRTILAELRMKAAINYLQQTDLSVNEISDRLGYASPSTFKNRFRQWTGKTPREVRLSH